MTVEMSKAWGYAHYLTGALWENMPEIQSGKNTTTKKKITFIPDDKKLEAVTTAIMLTIIGMKPTGTKPGVIDNKLQSSAPGIFQGFWRSRQDVGKDDLLDYRVLRIAITFLGKWYEPTSREAHAVLRIQKGAMLGLEKLKETYSRPSQKFLVEHIDSYLLSYQQFEETIKKVNPQVAEASESQLPSDNRVESKQSETIEPEEPFDSSLKEAAEIKESESIFDQQKTLWTLQDLEYVAKMAEEAREYFEKNNYELAQVKLKSLESKADEKILEWRQIIEDDNKKRSYLPSE